jgi:hypothetical protein
MNVTAIAVPPAAVISSITFCSFSFRRAMAMALAPSFARHRVIAAPGPELTLVTMATLFSSFVVTYAMFGGKRSLEVPTLFIHDGDHSAFNAALF